jgi:hypothetical protein
MRQGQSCRKAVAQSREAKFQARPEKAEAWNMQVGLSKLPGSLYTAGGVKTQPAVFIFSIVSFINY